METHRKNLEEAKKRDHRRLGKDLDLFSTMGDLGAGLVLWHPKGGFVRHKVEEFWRNQHIEGGYDIVYSPHVAKSDLWQTSAATSTSTRSRCTRASTSTAPSTCSSR